MTAWNSQTSSKSGSDMTVVLVSVGSQSTPPSSLCMSPHTIGGFMLWKTYSSPSVTPTVAPRFTYQVTACSLSSVKD